MAAYCGAEKEAYWGFSFAWTLRVWGVLDTLSCSLKTKPIVYPDDRLARQNVII